jgi:L-malate glycosyltransferase
MSVGGLVLSKSPLISRFVPMKKVLFITPTGGRTGSEMMLWYLLAHLKNRLQTAIYTRQNGDLFRNHSTADQTFIHATRRGFLYNLYEGIYHKIFHTTPEIHRIERLQRQLKPDFWYLNTIAMPDVAQLAIRLGVPYVLHIHELTSIFDDFKEQEFAQQLQHAKCLICCSKAVERRMHQMGYHHTVLKHSFIDVSQINYPASPAPLRQRYGIPADAFVWLMSGTMCLRKGYDLIPDLLAQMSPNSYLVWLGAGKDSGVKHFIEKSVATAQQNFIWLGSHDTDYYAHFDMADGFVLMAREDPHPLVMIEAAYLQKPIVGFNSGGISEFVLPGMGQWVNSFAPEDLAQLMQQVESGQLPIDRDLLRQRALQYDVKNQLPLWDFLEKM